MDSIKSITKFYFLKINIFTFEHYQNATKIKLFGILPIFRIKRKFNNDIQIAKEKDVRSLLQNNIDCNVLQQIEQSSNKILIIEPNMNYHSECLASYIKYFNDLGYCPDVVLSFNNYNLSPFCRCRNLKCDFYPFFNYEAMEILVNNSQIMQRYKLVLITTEMSLSGQIFPKIINGSKNIATITHIISRIEEYKIDEIPNNQCLILSNFKKGIPVINPHYFGDVNETCKNTDKTIFISVGRIQNDVKNYDLLLEAAKHLLKLGIKNFEVVLIGWHGEFYIEDNLKPYVKLKGKLSFERMFEEMEKADFYLSLLDDKNPEHLSYTHDKVTGSNQLVLAFKKPYLINSIYATAYGYNNKNAIIYSDDNLVNAMKYAIDMKQDAYQNLQKNIKSLANNLYQESIHTLKGVLDD